ncbi:DUF1624 domain-containing protein [Mucilaginibacter pocheonensis]|uniref:Membrane protein n=1 Tax=Mucilaginibacter pocheonensis TaxID=398050 RepID=A0ABU1TC40_9SPHI|nr:heparan-alpha-glucosaminide N-acetyltransferase domain-containing protein [Mucilaginibacter pocheonensis]MDR6942908.1 putative membrane protein [Mucilaginibacter pocheonensis]
MKRNESIDFMRGLVMIIMVLDHVRDFFYVTSLSQSPTDLRTTTFILFFTRWTTHLCAPTFVFLSGVSVYLSIKANRGEGARAFLLSRGLWLILLDFTLINFGMWFDIGFHFLIFEVIAAIGVSFIILSLLYKLPHRLTGVIGVIILALHNLIVFAPGAGTPLYQKILMPFFSPQVFSLGNGRIFFMGYPPVPWLGIMLVGFGASSFFQLPKERQKLLFLKIGLTAIALFIVLRAINIYGDPSPWTVQKGLLYTLLSFANVTKYPPSLLFCLLFLGIMFLILSWVQLIKNKWTDIVRVYGRVPLFYFLVHWYIIHPFVLIMVLLEGYKTSDMVFGSNFGRPKSGSGLQLWAVYLVWMSMVVLMYPICKWYGKYKTKHREKKWLRYI